MSFGGPPNHRPSSLPRSSSFSAPSRGNSRSVQAGRATEGEPSRGRPRRPSGRNNAPLQSRNSISLNSPRSLEPFSSQNDEDVLPIEDPDPSCHDCLSPHSMGPVAELYCRYLQETDTGLSPSQTVSLLRGSLLQPSEIRDRGLSTKHASPRFVISNTKYVDIRNIVHEVQDILDSLVLEMEQRMSGFMVDPGGKLLEALRGTDTVTQLENAWKYLTDRLFEGGRHVDKYYKQDRQEDVDSPRSTDPGFFDQDFYDGSVTDALHKHLSHPRQWTELGLSSSLPLDSLPALEYLRPINPVLLKKFPP